MRIGAIFAMLLLAWLPAQGSAAPLAGMLTCSADDGTQVRSWRLEIGGADGRVQVDGRPVAAVMSPSHVEIRLRPAGPVLTVGRQSGRLLVSAPDGRVLARGQCRPPPRA